MRQANLHMAGLVVALALLSSCADATRTTDIKPQFQESHCGGTPDPFKCMAIENAIATMKYSPGSGEGQTGINCFAAGDWAEQVLHDNAIYDMDNFSDPCHYEDGIQVCDHGENYGNTIGLTILPYQSDYDMILTLSHEAYHYFTGTYGPQPPSVETAAENFAMTCVQL